VILVDKKGNKASKGVVNKAIKGLAVEVAGPSKVKVHWFTSFIVQILCLFHSNVILFIISHCVAHR